MKKNLTTRIEQEALLEIENAYIWYESQSVGLGEQFKQALSEAFEEIKISANGFQKFRKHRQFPMEQFRFVILYEVSKDILYIDAVFHMSRNPSDKIR